MTLFGGLFRRSVSYQDVWGVGADWSEVVGTTAGRQLAIAATLACVDIKAASIRSMSIRTQRQTTEGHWASIQPAALTVDPSDLFSADEWIYAAVASMSLWDEAIGVVTDTRNGWPTRIEWLVPDTVNKRVDGGRVAYTVKGRPDREWRHGGDIVHIRRRPIPGRVDGGMSTAKAVADLVKVGTEGAKALVAHYITGGLPPALLSFDGPLDQDDADGLSERYEERRRKHPGRPLVTGKGWSITPLQRESMIQESAQIRQQVNTEIAVAHGVPPELVGGTSGGSMTYSTLEGLTQTLDVRALLPVYRAIELALSRLLPRPQRVRFNPDVVLRTSTIDRYRAHDIAIRSGMSSVDERRDLEDLAPLPGGAGEETLWPPYASSLAATQADTGGVTT